MYSPVQLLYMLIKSFKKWQELSAPHSPNKTLYWRPTSKRGRKLWMSQSRHWTFWTVKISEWEQKGAFWSTSCAQGAYHPIQLLYHTPGNALPLPSSCPNPECPAPQITLGQSRALKWHISKHDRRTADKIHRIRDWRGASSVLTEPSRHSLSTKKKY
jgi:hypothetical protein